MRIRLFGIFDYKCIENTPEYDYLRNKLISENRLEDISNDRKKSFILYRENDELKGLICNIGADIICKRKLV